MKKISCLLLFVILFGCSVDDRVFNKANEYLKEGHYEEALKLYDVYIKSSPKSPKGYVLRGTTYMNLGEYSKSLNDFEKALEIDHRIPLVYLGKGDIFVETKDYDKALENYRLLERENVFEDKIFDRIANVYLFKGMPEEALKYYNKQLEINPKSSDALQGKGIAFMHLKKCEIAIEIFNQGIQVNPNDYHSYMNKGLCNTELKNDCPQLSYSAAAELLRIEVASCLYSAVKFLANSRESLLPPSVWSISRKSCFVLSENGSIELFNAA